MSQGEERGLVRMRCSVEKLGRERPRWAVSRAVRRVVEQRQRGPMELARSSRGLEEGTAARAPVGGVYGARIRRRQACVGGGVHRWTSAKWRVKLGLCGGFD